MATEAQMSDILNGFTETCYQWWRWRLRTAQHAHCTDAWRDVYVALVRRYGVDAVLRHNRAIGAVLERAETRVRTALMQSEG